MYEQLVGSLAIIGIWIGLAKLYEWRSLAADREYYRYQREQHCKARQDTTQHETAAGPRRKAM